MVLALRMARSGWWQGDPDRVLEAPADTVMMAIHYEKFRSEYETACIEINKDNA